MGKCVALSPSVTQSGRAGLFNRADQTHVPKGQIHDVMPPSSKAAADFGPSTCGREAVSISRKNTGPRHQELLKAPALPLISCVTQRK